MSDDKPALGFVKQRRGHGGEVTPSSESLERARPTTQSVSEVHW